MSATSEETIFGRALERRAPAEREAFLAQACGQDEALRRRVEALLRDHELASSFLEQPVAPGLAGVSGVPPADTLDVSDSRAPHTPQTPSAAPGAAAGPLPLAERPGGRIGRYKLLQQIGEGGFGVVFMAEQERPVRRRVALKVIKAGMDTAAVVARFEAERQALAMMDHPNIARVLDAGATDTGRPYFVMELVKGVPVTEYCDQANLGTRQRLELFVGVCRAVQHAHQKGVIHRDLKPSNVMVTLHDGKPVVKVIDFGIAKATDQKLTEKTLFTQYGQMIGTPAYMSPEQAVMSGLDVDTRSDVYSLGVLLYELLTGSPPFDAKSLRSAGFDEMRRIIREQQPPKPSTRLGTLAADVRLSVAAQRQVSPQALSKQLAGDLDWIVLKAIEKDRTRRYESASAFAQDVERHLNSEPVSAAAPGALYRLSKFARRHKGAVAAGAAIVLLLLAGTAVSTWQAVRATRARGVAVSAVFAKDKALGAEAEQRHKAEDNERKASAAAAEAKAANEKAQKRLEQLGKAGEVLGSIFDSLDPTKIDANRRPLQAVLVERLDAAAAQLAGDSIGDPLIVAKVQMRLGRSLLGLGEPRKAVALLEKADATFRERTRPETPGPDNGDALSCRNDLAIAYEREGRLDLALPLLLEVVKIGETLPPDKRVTTVDPGPALEMALATYNNLAQISIEAGQRNKGMEMLTAALELARDKLGPDHEGTLTITNNLAIAYQNGGEAGKAVELLEPTVQRAKDRFGPEHPNTLVCTDSLAGAYRAAGRLDEAIRLYQEVLRASKATLGPDHLDTITTMHNLAGAYGDAGKIDQALPLHKEAIRLLEPKVAADSPRARAFAESLAMTYQKAGQLDQAIPLYEQVLRAERATLAPGHPDTLETLDKLASAYRASGKPDLAAQLLEEVLRHRRADLGPGHPATLAAMHNLAAVYWAQRRLDKSVPLYEEALKGYRAGPVRDPRDVPAAAGFLGSNYADVGRVAEALPLLEEACRAAGKYPDLRRFAPTLTEIYVAQRKSARAVSLAKEALAWDGGSSEDRIGVAAQLAALGRSLLKEEAFDDAGAVLRQCLLLREKAQPDHWSTFNTKSMLGSALLGGKKYAEAEALLLEGYNGISQREAQVPPQAKDRLEEALDRLIAFYESRGGAGDSEKAARYRKLRDERGAVDRRGAPPTDDGRHPSKDPGGGTDADG